MSVIDICCVDDHAADLVMWLASAVTLHDVGIQNVRDMVQKIIFRCQNSDKIGELRIIGHGNAYGQHFGSDWLDSKTVDNFRSELVKLQPLFASGQIVGLPWDTATLGGRVTLGGCKVGQASELLLALSDIFGVPVTAFTASQRPLVPGDQGGSTTCFISCTRSRAGFWDFIDN